MVKIITGNALDELKKLQSESVNCIVTSPPYYGLRDYGVEGQIGLEKTPEEYIEKLVAVFNEARRVLRKDGTLWVNIGDSYVGSTKGRNKNGEHCMGGKQSTNTGSCAGMIDKTEAPSCKPKDLIGIPWMLAFALRSDGWYLRQDMIWSKPNPMPESVTDRCTKSHEYIFLLSKSGRYYFDQNAILEPTSENTHARISQDLMNQIGSHRANGGNKTNGPMKAVSRKTAQGEPGVIKNNISFDTAICMPVEKRNRRSVWTVPVRYGGNKYTAQPDVFFRTKSGNAYDFRPMRNKRSVWSVSTKGFSEAHFATFPPDLIRPCILAGCPQGGVVLDMFGGSGTVGEVASECVRDAILIDLKPEYSEMARQRCGLFIEEVMSNG